MAYLTALEASTGIITVLCGSAAAMREFNTDLVAHEITFMIFGHAFFRGLAIVKFLGTMSMFTIRAVYR